LVAFGCEITTEELKKILQYKKFAKRFIDLNITPDEIFAYFMNLIHYVTIPKIYPKLLSKTLLITSSWHLQSKTMSS
jgi:hypothetical protein